MGFRKTYIPTFDELNGIHDKIHNYMSKHGYYDTDKFDDYDEYGGTSSCVTYLCPDYCSSLDFVDKTPTGNLTLNEAYICADGAGADVWGCSIQPIVEF